MPSAKLYVLPEDVHHPWTVAYKVNLETHFGYTCLADAPFTPTDTSPHVPFHSVPPARSQSRHGSCEETAGKTWGKPGENKAISRYLSVDGTDVLSAHS